MACANETSRLNLPTLLSQTKERLQTNALIPMRRKRGSLCTFNNSERVFLHSRYEFGGPWGVLAIMTGFPILMYYLWICLWFYDGKLVLPTSVDDVVPYLWRMWEQIRVVRFLMSCRGISNS